VRADVLYMFVILSSWFYTKERSRTRPCRV
jgi:hypothetical protein